MDRVNVYPFMVHDRLTEKYAFSLHPATEDAIRRIEGARAITGLVKEVDSGQVDENGYLIE